MRSDAPVSAVKSMTAIRRIVTRIDYRQSGYKFVKLCYPEQVCGMRELASLVTSEAPAVR
jgi:hypothetical protein